MNLITSPLEASLFVLAILLIVGLIVVLSGKGN